MHRIDTTCYFNVLIVYILLKLKESNIEVVKREILETYTTNISYIALYRVTSYFITSIKKLNLKFN